MILTEGNEGTQSSGARRTKENVHIPNVLEVPMEAPVCGPRCDAKVDDWRIDDQGWPEGGVALFPHQVKGGSNAQDVKHDAEEEPEQPASQERALGIGGVNLRFGLVCGRRVHGRSRDLVNSCRNAPEVEVPEVTFQGGRTIVAELVNGGVDALGGG